MRKLKLIMIILLLVLAGCRPKDQMKSSEVIPVKAMRVTLSDLSETIDYIGNIKAQDEVLVYPKVSGKISEKVKEDGAFVNKGDAICYIDRDEVGLKFERAPVEAPINGVVGRVYVDLGSNVAPDTAVALVVNMDKAKIDLAIPEKYLARVSLGQEAKVFVDAYPEMEFGGKVVKISPVVDLETRAAPLEISVANPDHRLQSGMFAKVKLVVGVHKGVPVILKEALIGKEPDTYVYIVKGNKAALTRVSLGLRQGPLYEETEGVNDGDLVVVMGLERLRDGVDVRVEEAR